jgi:hypothetical protein
VKVARSSISGIAFLLFGRLLESGQMVHPEFVDELPNVSQWLYSGAVETAVPVSSLVHKA